MIKKTKPPRLKVDRRLINLWNKAFRKGEMEELAKRCECSERTISNAFAGEATLEIQSAITRNLKEMKAGKEAELKAFTNEQAKILKTV